MRHSFRAWMVIVVMFAAGGSAGLVGGAASAKAKKTDAATAGPAKAVNACGCYKDTAGACFCGRKGKCACPGDCEPKGCEEKRQKEFDKEVAAEKKKAAEADKKQRQSAHDSSKPPKHKTDGTGQ